MKLKKIASLMLAGVMAVTMLTACGSTINEQQPPVNGGDDDNQVSGYSQMLHSHLSTSGQKKVTPEDSNIVNQALQTAMGYAADGTIAGIYDDGGWFGTTELVNDWNWPAAPRSIRRAAVSLIDTMDAENTIGQGVGNTFNVLDPNVNNYNSTSLNISMLFVADGGKEMNAVMDEVADIINSEVEWLEDDFDLPGDFVDVGGHSMNTDYDYTMSVAADTITLTADHGKSLTFVAVNIARV